MTIFFHELRRGRTALIIWTAVIAFMLAVCLLIYPQMSTQMGDISAMFADMGGFSQAFGMDKINFGEFIGYFGVECANILGIGGAFFAAILGMSALAKEEKDKTAEFLLTHPISRKSIVAQKLLAMAAQVLILNLVCAAVTVLCVLAIGVSVPVGTLTLLLVAYLLMQFQVAAVTFGISAFISRGSLGVGIGLAAMFYFMNIIANLTSSVAFLKYLTPFGYTESSDIILHVSIDSAYLAAGMAMATIGIVLAFAKYTKKDIAS